MNRTNGHKILIIDDEADWVELLRDTLEQKGYQVTVAYDGLSGLEKARERPDLILLDIMMPGLDGYELCQRIRDAVLIPILFLSAKQSETDKIKALALGGDDYIVKPFSLKELLARIEAHLRREARSASRQPSLSRAHLRFGPLTVDLKAHQAMIDGRLIPLTKKEFAILELLALHAGQVFSKEQIYERIWGYDAEGDAATVTEHVRNIRAKLDAADPDTVYIKTVWGIGYRFDPFA
ncbi:MAG: Two-component response regulator [Candidatus Carbobacillus altaicus]|uniref:Two-component response regulator n=1 Tax=Candidatus Carbonibacillus altaicus TaxID=2163959 RepID=A0A2R6Y3F4_9BACL|nr:MAG: Two-component response regulator [Candidatus Carbobacillus altaicus]